MLRQKIRLEQEMAEQKAKLDEERKMRDLER